jgi:OOP family OmpA-OmpF porin
MDSRDKCKELKYYVREPEATIYFAFDKAGINKEGMHKLNKLVSKVRHSDTIISVAVIGYADRIGTSGYNYNLSKRRANNVSDYLEDRGIETRVIDSTYMGDRESEANNSCSGSMSRADEIACLRKDRKVEVTLELMYPGDDHMYYHY